MAAATVSVCAISLSSAAFSPHPPSALRRPGRFSPPVHAPGTHRPGLSAPPFGRPTSVRCRVAGLDAGDARPPGDARARDERRDDDRPGGIDLGRMDRGRGDEGVGERLGSLADRPGALSPFGGDVIRVGRRHPEVRRARRLLKDTGFLSRYADDTDLFDPAMREAVRLFQEVSGLLTDGVLGPTTKDTLRRVALGAPVTDAVSDYTATTQAICALMLVGASLVGRLLLASLANTKSSHEGPWSCGCWPFSEPVRKIMYTTSVAGVALYTAQLICGLWGLRDPNLRALSRVALYTAQLIRGLWDLRDTGLPALARWGDPIFRPILLGLLAVAVTDDSLAVRPRQWERAAIHALGALVRALLAPFRAVLGVNEPERGLREVEEKVGRGVHEVGEKVLGKREGGGNGEDKRREGRNEREKRNENDERRGGERRDEGEGHEGQGFRIEGMRRGGEQRQGGEGRDGGGQREGQERGGRQEQNGQNRGIDDANNSYFGLNDWEYALRASL
ncbi:hypothetical protein KFL_002370190 [Klebsormidium nitens]|uniref:Peptidoglycan binding-like domain-containing protein n=1 Tax=Klebsormidium nitens TaxID=105231 RepID=A0A1Y1I3H5_KLENI|nr:hypothetical protein KFL_002370190 [Klebsormidium nitens]|eukprot:GAQ85484.1 hypothetical protein KFL_002370190 [Klebsormidium nitens]